MRWPGIRDGNRRQGFFKGKGTGHDATSRHTGSRRGATQRGRSRNWRMTQGINRNLVQRTGQTTTIRIQEGRRDHTRLDDTRGAAPRIAEEPARGRLQSSAGLTGYGGHADRMRNAPNGDAPPKRLSLAASGRTPHATPHSVRCGF